MLDSSINAFRLGSVSVKFVPTPNVELTSIVMWSEEATFLAKYSPIPVEAWLLWVEVEVKPLSKILGKSCVAIP